MGHLRYKQDNFRVRGLLAQVIAVVLVKVYLAGGMQGRVVNRGVFEARHLLLKGFVLYLNV